MEDKIINYFKNLDVRLKVIFVSAAVWALIAHGISFFHVTSFHDDAKNLFAVGSTYELGRWALALTADFIGFFFGKAGGSGHISMRLCAAASIICFLSMTVWYIVKILDIKSIIGSIFLTGVFVTCPMISALMGYTFTVFYYMFGVFLSVYGAYLFCRYKKWYTILLGSGLVCWSVGIYQAFFPLTVSLVLLYYIKETNDDTIINWKKFFIRGIWYLLGITLSMLLYFTVTKLSVLWSHVNLDSYKNISNMGQEGIMVYLKRIPLAYKYFFAPIKYKGNHLLYTVFPLHTRSVYQIFIWFTVLLTFIHLDALRRVSKIKACQFSLLLLCLPIAVNFILIMCPLNTLSVLMAYGSVMFFVFNVWLIENTAIKKEQISNMVYVTNFIGFLILNIMYCRFDNFIATKSIFIQERTFSYFTSLIANIKGTPDYKDEFPIVFLNEGEIKDLNVVNIDFPDIVVAGQYSQHLINSYSWLDFMKNWCAYSPQLGNASDFINLPEVRDMPHYPDYGSIRVIKETVVVKF